MKMRYYCIKQHDITDCGAACLATISKQHGLKTSITRIREAAEELAVALMNSVLGILLSLALMGA